MLLGFGSPLLLSTLLDIDDFLLGSSRDLRLLVLPHHFQLFFQLVDILSPQSQLVLRLRPARLLASVAGPVHLQPVLDVSFLSPELGVCLFQPSMGFLPVELLVITV